jgi:hypothetical protein
MKTITIPFALVIFIFTGLFHMNMALAKDDQEAILKEIEALRPGGQERWKEIVALNMGLTEEEANKFWPLYTDYMDNMHKANDRLIKLIAEYADSYVNNSLTDEEAKRLIKEYLSIEDQKINTKKKYTKKFHKVLSPVLVMRFLQIDNKLTTMVDAGLASEIPLAE